VRLRIWAVLVVRSFQSAALAWEEVVNLADEFESPLRILFSRRVGANLFPTFGLFLHSLLLLFGDGIRVGATLTGHDIYEGTRRTDNNESEYSKEDCCHRSLLTAKHPERILP